MVDSRSSPTISVITVVLNGAQTLERTLRSVFDQGAENFEYVIVDGGSTDGSLDIIRRYESRIAHWRSEPDQGLYDAMNKAARVAKGKWVLFLGADDMLVADLREISSLLRDERTVYYGDAYMPRRQVLYDGRFSAYKIMFKNICQQAIFYPREVFATYSFDQRYRLWADHALNIALYGDKRFRFAYLDRQICIFNDSTGASSHAEDAVFKADRAALIRKHLSPFLFLLYLLRNNAAKLKRWSVALIAPR